MMMKTLFDFFLILYIELLSVLQKTRYVLIEQFVVIEKQKVKRKKINFGLNKSKPSSAFSVNKHGIGVFIPCSG